MNPAIKKGILKNFGAAEVIFIIAVFILILI